jgi:hypothetical protein
MNKKRLCCRQIAAVALLSLSFPVTTFAHREDYIDETSAHVRGNPDAPVGGLIRLLRSR